MEIEDNVVEKEEYKIHTNQGVEKDEWTDEEWWKQEEECELDQVPSQDQ